MAATFTQALIAAYAGIAVPSGHTALPTIWAEQIAETETDYPRADFNHMGEVPTFNSDGSEVVKWDARCQLCFFDTALATVETMATDVMDGLTPGSLTITGKENRLWPPTYRLGIAQERTTDQRPVFMAILEYHCEISEG